MAWLGQCSPWERARLGSSFYRDTFKQLLSPYTSSFEEWFVDDGGGFYPMAGCNL